MLHHCTFDPLSNIRLLLLFIVGIIFAAIVSCSSISLASPSLRDVSLSLGEGQLQGPMTAARNKKAVIPTLPAAPQQPPEVEKHVGGSSCRLGNRPVELELRLPLRELWRLLSSGRR